MLRAPRITCGSNLQDCGPLVRNQVQRKGHLIRIRTSFCTFFTPCRASIGQEVVWKVLVQKELSVTNGVEQFDTRI